MEQESSQEIESLQKKFKHISPQLISQLGGAYFKPLVQALLNLDHIEEKDPILIIIPDIADENSINYCIAGNYGLHADEPVYLPWPGGTPPVAGQPLTELVDAIPPPNALGIFFANQHGATDISAGHCRMFRIDNLHDLNVIGGALRNSVQFRRVGPAVANYCNTLPQQPLVKFAFLYFI